MQKHFFALVKKEITKAKRILVATHVSPDFDAISSVLALGMILKQQKKSAYLYIPYFEAKRWADIPEAKEIHPVAPRGKIDLLIGLDYGKMERLGVSEVLKRDDPVVISVDHHPYQNQKGKIRWIDPTKAATAEMLYELAKAWKVPMHRELANLLLLGIVGDTVGLAVGGTPEVFRMLTDLVSCGGDLSKAQDLYREWGSLEDFEFLSRAAERAKIDSKLHFIVSTVTQKDRARFRKGSEHTSRIVTNLNLVHGVEIALLLVEENGSWYGHLRSRPESKVNLGKIAEAFGGGGHKHAAGFKSPLAVRAIVSRVKKLLTRLPKR